MSAREYLQDIVEQLELQALELHVRGMMIQRRAAKLEQLCDMASDDQVTVLLNGLREDGLIEIADGEARITEQSDRIDSRITTKGGKA